MNPLLPALRGCFHQAASSLRCSASKLIREFGLDDFATNIVQEGDDAPTLTMKALTWFCEDARPVDTQYQIAVLAVCIFLNSHYATPPRSGIPTIAAQDLVALLRQGLNELHHSSLVPAHHQPGC
jgi:hypothetical protein